MLRPVRLLRDHAKRGAPVMIAVALLANGCCDRFSRSKIEEGARGDATASRVAWTQRLPDAVNDQHYGVASTSSGEIVVAATVHAGVEIGRTELADEGAKAGQSSLGDVVVWKLSAQGKPQWASRFGGGPEERVSSLAINGAGIAFVGGSFHRAFRWGPYHWDANADVRGGFVATLDTAGKPGWGTWFDATPVKLEHGDASVRFGAAVESVAVDPLGHLFVLGTYAGKLRMKGKLLIEDDRDRVGGTFLARFDPGGALRWYKMGSYPESPKATDAAPPAQPTFFLEGLDLCTTRQAHVAVLGISRGNGGFAGATLRSMGDASLFVSMFTYPGEHLWTSQFATKGPIGSPRVVAADDGSLFVVGATGGEIALGATTVKADAGTGDAAQSVAALFAARVDPKGNVAWAKRIGTVEMSSPIGLSAIPAGGFVVSATMPLDPGNSTDMGGGALFDKPIPGHAGAIGVASYGADGTHRWSRGFTSAERNSAGAVTMAPNGRAVLVGTVNRGECVSTCETKQLGDVFVAALGK